MALVEDRGVVVGRTTTLSTIAMSSSPPTPSSPPTRLVVALLQTPHKGLHLKVLELSPPLLLLPDNLQQAQLALSDHDAVIRNLQSKQSPVEELLRQADSLIATQKPRAEVYAAMAESLGSAWSQLSSVLEARRSVLSLAVTAHQEIDAVTRRIEATHKRCSKLQEDQQEGEEEEEELPPLEWLKAERAGILKGVASALEACDALLGQIGSFSYSIDSRDLILLQDANTANRQVQRWLERLHDRRVLLEERLRVKREEVEEKSRAYRAESDLTTLEVEVEGIALGLESTTLGDSLVDVMDREEPNLLRHSGALKVAQEKTLALTRSLEHSEAPKYTIGASDLRKRAFELLARTTDLLAESNDLELSLTNAATFFRLVGEGEDEEAIHLGDDLIHTHPPHRTQGIRAVHAKLTAKKEEEIRELDNHNAFLTSLNEAFELLLVSEERLASVPLPLENIGSFIESHNVELARTTREVEGRLRSLEEALSTQGNNKLREEEELQTRTRELQVLLQRWRTTVETRISVAELWKNFLQHFVTEGGRVESLLTSIARTKSALQEQNAVNASEALAYLDDAERRVRSVKEIISTATRRLQEGEEQLEEVWPILGGNETTLLIPTPPALTHIAEHVLPLKSDTARASVFGGLRSSLKSRVDSALGRTRRDKLLHEEEEFNVLVSEKEGRYVEVVEEIRRFLRSLGEVCTMLGEEERRNKSVQHASAQEELSALERFQGRVEEAWGLRLHPQLESLVRLIFRVESVDAARKEEKAIRGLSEVMRREWIEERLGSTREALEGRLRAELVAADLAVIGEQLDDLVRELEKPPSYGDSLRDAQVVLQNFERFERTVEVLETKLKEMLRKAGDVGDEEQRLKEKLKKLQTLRGGRKQALLLSLDYFSLIREWEEEWERLESTLSSIRLESKTTNISGDRIESLLSQVQSLRSDEARQEDRLSRINEMAKRLFPEEIRNEQTRSQDKNTLLSTKLKEVEEELKAILRAMQVESENRKLEEERRLKEAEMAAVEEQIAQEELFLQKKKKEEASSLMSSTTTATTTTHVRFRDEQASRPEEQSTRVESGEWEELRRSTATPTTLEKETQIEVAEERFTASPLPPRKVEREVVTQTPLPGEIGVTAETQTEDDNNDRAPSGGAGAGTAGGPPPPAIVEPLLDVSVEEGQRVVLACRTSGPVGPLVWLKDGMDVSSNADFKTSFDEVTGVASLTIDEVVPEDAAVFTCRALGGSLETSGRLTVKEAEETMTTGEVFSPPTWVSGPASVEVTEGEGPVVVEGVVEGYPLPTVTWEKDGRCIDLSHDYVLTFNNGRAMLLIEDPLADLDTGNFTAIAVNRLGEARLTFSLRIRKVEKRKGDECLAPLIIRPLPKRLLLHTGQRGDRLVLRLEYTKTNTSPEPSVTWTLNDSHKIEPNSAGSKIESGGGVASLTYESVVPSMSGKYTATLRNPYGSASTECQVTIKGVRPLETSDSEIGQSDMEAMKPTVKMALEDVRNAEIGKPARLDCVIVGVPEPEVIWYHDGVPVKESLTHHLTFTGDRCSLLLTSVTPKDLGVYLVQAINAVGETSSSARLTLKEEEKKPIIEEEREPPKFTKLLEDAMVSAGDLFQFSVEVGEPKDNVEVTWYRNNERLLPVPPSLRMTEHNGKFSLEWTSVSPADKGNYMAKATRHGKETKTFACLIVKDIPSENKVPPSPPAIPTTSVRRPSFPNAKAVTRAPRFVTDLQGQMVNEGDMDVCLRGLLEAGGADVEVVWKKGPSLVLTESSKYLLQTAKGSGDVSLTIRGPVEVVDGGVYTVSASNSAGTASSSAQLLVKKTTFPPVFNKRLEGTVTLLEGKRLFLEVDVFAVPPPNVTWTMAGGKQLREGVVVSSDTPTRFSFAIPEANATTDSGEVTVTARNSAGEAKSRCVIEVIPGQKLLTQETTMKEEEQQLKQEMMTLTTSRTEEMTLTEERTIVKDVIAVTRVSTSVSPNFVERGPSPEILVAPSPTPTWTKSSENAVLKKVKTFEERSVVEIPPAGGVITLPTPPPPPVKEKPTPPPKPAKIISVTPPAVSVPPPITTQFVPPPPPLEKFEPLPTLREKPIPPPKPFVYAAPPPPAQERPKSETFFYPLGGIPQEQQQQQRPRSELLASPTFRPSKFIPEKMRESSYSTDTSPIPPLWAPSTQPPPPQPPPPPVTTTSAFARTVPTQSFVPAPVSSPQKPPPQEMIQLKKSPVPPPSQPPPPVPPPSSAGVKAIASTWPPLASSEVEGTPRNLAAPPSQQRLLSPISVQVTTPVPHSRSPTPNMEALEMERSWSRPIRFASPRPSSPLRSPQIKTSPAPHHPPPPIIKSPINPPPTTTIIPIKPIPPPKPTAKSPSPSIYYVSITSPPRTTPIPPMSPPPPPMSPLPLQPPLSLSPLPQTSTFTSSYESSSYFESSFTSTTKTTDPSELLVPGETPQFLYSAPPPSKPGPQPTTQMRGGPSTSSTQPPPPPPQVSSTSTSMALVPYIKPSKFHPLSDSTWSESASRTTTTAGDDSRILPLWSGDPRGVRVTTWKRVEPPKDSVVVVDDLTVVADTKERLLNLKKNFKDTIEGLEPGFLYNELRRKIESSLDEGHRPVEGEPLLYFKYDFGYEFGLADPRAVINIDGKRQPGKVNKSSRSLLPPPSTDHRGHGDGDGVIHLPVIHETKKTK